MDLSSSYSRGSLMLGSLVQLKSSVIKTVDNKLSNNQVSFNGVGGVVIFCLLY